MVTKRTTQKSGKTQKQITKCAICGHNAKHLNADGIGALCEKHQKNGLDLAELRRRNTFASIPENYISVGALDKIVKKAQKSGKYPGLSVNRMVNCIGRDRGAKEPLHPIARPYYSASGTRYVHPWLGTHDGLMAMATLNWKKAPALQETDLPKKELQTA